MFDHTEIKTRRDGSIDTDFYRQRGRVQRSEEAHRLVKEICGRARVDVPKPQGLFQRLFGHPGTFADNR